jgi:hypothetical protein
MGGCLNLNGLVFLGLVMMGMLILHNPVGFWNDVNKPLPGIYSVSR